MLPCLKSRLLVFRVGEFRGRRHASSEAGISLCSRGSRWGGTSGRWCPSSWWWGILCRDILPGIPSYARCRRIAVCCAIAIVFCVVLCLLLGIRKDLVGGLYRLKLGVDLGLSTRVAIGMVLEGYNNTGAVSRESCLERRRRRVPSFLNCFLTSAMSDSGGSSRSA